MAKLIRVDAPYVIKDGSEILFYAPCNYSEITGLKVYYTDPTTTQKETSKDFVFCDAEGNDLSDLENLFAEGVCVKAILSVTLGKAFVQNEVTNAYIEEKFKTKLDKTKIKVSTTDLVSGISELDTGVLYFVYE